VQAPLERAHHAERDGYVNGRRVSANSQMPKKPKTHASTIRPRTKFGEKCISPVVGSSPYNAAPTANKLPQTRTANITTRSSLRRSAVSFDISAFLRQGSSDQRLGPDNEDPSAFWPSTLDARLSTLPRQRVDPRGDEGQGSRVEGQKETRPSGPRLSTLAPRALSGPRLSTLDPRLLSLDPSTVCFR
jgi:hypothetical protein